MLRNRFSLRRNKPLTRSEIKIYKNYRIVHGIRIALAFVITFLILRLVNLPDHSWPLITLVVVMGPMSFVGNVIPRAFERIGGTIIGALLGLIALHIEIYSLTAMMIWCGCAAFLCGYLTVSKRPYAALLIGITLAVVSSAPAGDMQTALWRGTNIILGCILAMLFSSIYPQRAFIHWRIQLAAFLTDYSKLSAAGFSSNMISRPDLKKTSTRIANNVIKMRGLLVPASKETGIPKAVLEEIQSVTRDMLAGQRFMIEAYWASRASRFLLLNSQTLADVHHMTQQTLQALSAALHEGNISPIKANSERLNQITTELHELLQAPEGSEVMESAVYGYVWLSMQLAVQLETLSALVHRAFTDKTVNRQQD